MTEDVQTVVCNKETLSLLTILDKDTLMIQHGLPGKNLKLADPLSYEIELSNDQIIRRHTDHIYPSEVNSDDMSVTTFDDVLDDVLPFTTHQPPTSGCHSSQRDQCPPKCFQA